MRPRTDIQRQTDTQTRVTTIHFASSTIRAKCDNVPEKNTNAARTVLQYLASTDVENLHPSNDTQEEFDIFYTRALQLLDQFYPERTATVIINTRLAVRYSRSQDTLIQKKERIDAIWSSRGGQRYSEEG